MLSTIFFLLITMAILGEARRPVVGRQRFPNQKKSCRGGQAVSVFWIAGGVPGTNYLEFAIACVNFTAECEEKCEYKFACEAGSSNTTTYLKGFEAIYNRITGIQRMLFLCCTSKNKVHQNANCTKMLKPIQKHPSADDKHRKGAFIQWIVSAFTRAHDGSIGHKLSISSDTCVVQSRETIELCPLRNSHVKIPPQTPWVASEDAFAATALAATPIVSGVVPAAIGIGLAIRRCCCAADGDICNNDCVCPGFDCNVNICNRISG